MATRSDKKTMERASITAFYAGRSIFITGGTGFLGKVLVEKLLRSCPEIREIFLLMRPKNGVGIDDRLRQMLQCPLFDKLREEKPSTFEKLIPVGGDATVEGLGLGTPERRLLTERVSVIFHVAANVRFDANLKKDVFANTRSTRDVCILAGGMKNLVALVHVSSAFAQCDKPVVDEIVYPPITDWRSVIKIAENMDEKTIKIISPKYLGSMPNTYTFSKRVAEDVISDYGKSLPSVIFRPSIVISTIQEPIIGWIDNFNGPVGMLIGGGKGILRVVFINPYSASDYLPVDVTIKSMITVAWKRGVETITKDPTVHVYNCTSHDIRRIVNKELVAMGMRINRKLPLDGIIWYPRTLLTNNRVLYYLLTLLFHILPAMLIDGVLKLTGRKPILLGIQEKIYLTVVQLGHFLHNEWIFRNAKMLNSLTKDVPPSEKSIFGYDYSHFDIERFFQDALIGAKRYLLHEDLSRLEALKRHYNRMEWIDRIFNVCLATATMWVLCRVGFFSYVADKLTFSMT
ncbi:putative fatty acyl-CoA reductase CG5065 [Colletes gigas]|uniref:putative fatty acyl-CoA reductase CG5065 n=1 Tax=Colletes gigas TaxID=935657 RepID=UPI001C9B0877|nr:putative fatty acyl-CoA reductase CG5065 [Colletes gigas]